MIVDDPTDLGLDTLETLALTVVVSEPILDDHRPIRVQRALLNSASAGDKLAGALALANDAGRENTALAEEAAKRYQTTAARVAKWPKQRTTLKREQPRERYVAKRRRLQGGPQPLRGTSTAPVVQGCRVRLAEQSLRTTLGRGDPQ